MRMMGEYEDMKMMGEYEDDGWIIKMMNENEDYDDYG
jgi:hypothetical protein